MRIHDILEDCFAFPGVRVVTPSAAQDLFLVLVRSPSWSQATIFSAGDWTLVRSAAVTAEISPAPEKDIQRYCSHFCERGLWFGGRGWKNSKGHLLCMWLTQSWSPASDMVCQKWLLQRSLTWKQNSIKGRFEGEGASFSLGTQFLDLLLPSVWSRNLGIESSSAALIQWWLNTKSAMAEDLTNPSLWVCWETHQPSFLELERFMGMWDLTYSGQHCPGRPDYWIRPGFLSHCKMNTKGTMCSCFSVSNSCKLCR